MSKKFHFDDLPVFGLLGLVIFPLIVWIKSYHLQLHPFVDDKILSHDDNETKLLLLALHWDFLCGCHPSAGLMRSGHWSF